MPIQSGRTDDADPEWKVQEVVLEGEVGVIGVEEDASAHCDDGGLDDGGGEAVHEGLLLKDL